MYQKSQPAATFPGGRVKPNRPSHHRPSLIQRERNNAKEAPLTTQQPDADGFIPLFDGKTLEGWKPNENPQTWSVQDGSIIVHGLRSHLFYVGPVASHDFRDFHLKAELMTFPNANSGIYFHTKWQDEGWPEVGYEAQVNSTHHDPKKTGGLYAIADVMNDAPVPDGVWYTYEIIVRGKHIVLKVNDQITCDWTEPDNWQPPEGFEKRRLSSGTFCLQGHDPNSRILYRDVRVKLL
jgi:hypothetical protein